MCRRLWSEEVVEHHGEFFDFQPVMFAPKPIQQPIPVIVGGDSPAALRRTANLGDGWIPMNTPLDKLGPQIVKVNKMRADAGRPGTTEVTIGGSAKSVDDFQRYRDVGVGRIMCTPFASSAKHSKASAASATKSSPSSTDPQRTGVNQPVHSWFVDASLGVGGATRSRG